MTKDLRCAICTKTWDEHKTVITHDFKHDPRPSNPLASPGELLACLSSVTNAKLSERGRQSVLVYLGRYVELMSRLGLASDAPLPDETSDKPVAWRYLADSAYEQRPRWVYFEENTPTVRLVAEGRTLEPLYSRGSPEEPTRPLPDSAKAPVKAGEPCPAVEDVHTEHAGKCMYCGAPMAPEKATAPRKTRYCDYDLCADTFDPAHSNNDH